MHSLTNNERARARVVYAALVTALVMNTVNEQIGLGKNQPAVQQLQLLIDEMVAGLPEERKQLVLFRVQRERLRFNQHVRKIDSGSALIAAVEVLIGPTFKSKIGTRFDFIRGTLRNNLPLVKQSVPFTEASVKLFHGRFTRSILDV